MRTLLRKRVNFLGNKSGRLTQRQTPGRILPNCYVLRHACSAASADLHNMDGILFVAVNNQALRAARGNLTPAYCHEPAWRAYQNALSFGNITLGGHSPAGGQPAL